MKKFLFLMFGLFFVRFTFAWLQDQIIPDDGSNIIINTSKWGTWVVYSVLDYIKESIFGLLALIAIIAFIFIGAKLVMARWNPEEFKKAMLHFVYAIVGLAIVALSWWIVKLITSLNF